MKPVESCQIKDLDKIIEEYLPHTTKESYGYKKGTFVEVGAHDGKSYSNTYHLAHNGWEGVYVEPIYYKECRGNHEGNAVIVMECACSNYDGQLALHQGPDIYTANLGVIETGGQTILVTCKTLDTILQETLVIDIDLLVIDVEFHEKEVLEGFSLDKYKPRMVIIEAHEQHENEKFKLNVEFINNYFKDYKKIYSDGINNIYVL